MIIFIQYTICDSRVLTGEKNELLDKPNWKNVTPFKDFVCGSGQIIQRTKRGLNNWIGENYICKINKGVYNFPEIKIPNQYQIKCIGKHQFSDGDFLHKYEFVFQYKNLNPDVDDLTFSHQELHDIIDTIFSNKVKIRNLNYKYEYSTLGKSFKNLKDFHINCTTKNQFLLTQNKEDIKICMPQVFFLLQEFEQLSTIPKKVLKANTPSNLPIEMYGWLEQKRSFPHRFWLLREEDKRYPNIQMISRMIRISCLRIHSEIECIKSICNLLSSNIKERSVESDLIQSFLNDSIKKIGKGKKKIEKISGIDNIDIYIKQIFDEIEPGIVSQIISNIENLNFRKNIQNKTINFFNNKGQIHLGSGDNVLGNKNIGK